MATNREMAQTDQTFRAACQAAGVEPNRTQYRKWCARRGIAYLTAHNTTRELQKVGVLDNGAPQVIASVK